MRSGGIACLSSWVAMYSTHSRALALSSLRLFMSICHPPQTERATTSAVYGFRINSAELPLMRSITATSLASLFEGQYMDK